MQHRIRIAAMLASFAALLLPFLSSAQDPAAAPDAIIPCRGGDCTFQSLIKLIDNIIDYFLLYLVMPLCIVAFSYSGFLFMTAGGNAGKRTQAAGVFRKVAIGLMIVLGAWVLVQAVLSGFGLKDGWSLLGDGNGL